MPKFRRIYRCRECGHAESKWMGRCPSCGAWNSMDEDAEMISPPSAKKKGMTEFTGEILPLSRASAGKSVHTPTGRREFDRVMGGGVIDGQVSLLAGPPGVGKSTLMLSVAAGFAAKKGRVLYVSGEESSGQIAERAGRMEVPQENILLLSETDIFRIIAAIKKSDPRLVVLDSVQTVFNPDVPSVAGSLPQVRECAGELIRFAKSRNVPVFMLGHITKDGNLAGPKTLEHMVDTVLYMDIERNQSYRVLRSAKNRFGPTDEIGVFEITEKGLVDAGDFFSFSPDPREKETGRSFAVAAEGSRCIPVEIQALVSKTYYPYPRRIVSGADLNRVQVLIAAIEKKLGIHFDSKDVFISVQGGLKIKDSALDLALCAAVISSAKDIPLPSSWGFFGEVGILAKVAPVPFESKRIMEGKRLGFDKIFIPRGKRPGRGGVVKVADLEELMTGIGQFLRR